MSNNSEPVLPEISAIHNNLSFSRKSVYLWVQIPTVHYEFVNDGDRIAAAEALTNALASLSGGRPEEVECHLLVLPQKFDVNHWLENYLNRNRLYFRGNQQVLTDYANRMANHLRRLEFSHKSVYLGVKIGDRNEYGKTRTIFNIKAVDSFISKNLLGSVDEHLSAEEIEFWVEKSTLYKASLTSGQLAAEEVDAATVAFLAARPYYPAMPPVTVNDLNVSNKESWGEGELKLIGAGVVKNNLNWLEITQNVGVDTHTGFRATLSFVTFPDSIHFPIKAPWIHALSEEDIDYIFSSRFTLIPAQKMRTQVGNVKKGVLDQITNLYGASKGSIEGQAEQYQAGGNLASRLQRIQSLENSLENSERPWILARHRVAIEAKSVKELKNTAQSLIDKYRALGFGLIWSMGDQVDLMLEQMPNDKVRLAAYHQWHSLDIIGAGLPNASGGTGDQITKTQDGREAGWIGPYVGFTNSRILEPVFLSPHVAMAKNQPPAITITGAPGSGKTFFALNMIYNMILGGVQCVFIDPKMDALALARLPGCEDATIIDLANGEDGILDPFIIGESEGEKLDLALDLLTMFIGRELTPIQQAEVNKLLKELMRETYPTFSKFKELLRHSNVVEAAALGETLDVISKLPFARLAFSTASPDNPPAAGLSFDSQLTIITLLGLDLPSAGTPPSGYSSRNKLAVALLSLITSFTKRVMTRGDYSTNPTPKAIIVDEAWAVTSTTAGAKLIADIARLGRSMNTALLMMSQSTRDFTEQGVLNSISTRIVYGARDINEINSILEFLGLPQTVDAQETIRALEQGTCLIKDVDGRIARVMIDINSWNPQFKQTIETNPEIKRQMQGVEESSI